MWDQLVDAVREVTAAHPDAAAEVVAMSVCSQYSSIVPVDADGEPVAPMLMWQDQRGTDHSFDDHEPRRERVHDVRSSATASRRSAAGCRSATSSTCSSTEPDVHAATAAYVEAMDYVTARLTGPHHRVAAHVVHGAAAATTARSARPSYDDELVQLAGVDATRLPPLVPVDARDRPAPARRRRRARASRESVVVYAPTNDTAAVAVATGAFTAGRAGLAIGTTSVLVDAVADFRTDLEHQILSMPGPVRRPLRRVRGERAGRQGRSSTCSSECVYADDDARRPPRRRRRSRSSTRCWTRPTPGAGGVLFLPWLDGSLAPTASGIDPRRLREHVARDRPGRPRARGRRGRRPQPRVAAPARRGVHRRRDRRDRVRRRRGALRARGARCWPTCSAGRSSPLDRARGRRRPGDGACSRSSATACSRRDDLDRAAATDAAPLRARSRAPRALRIPSGAVRGRVRGAPPDQ